MRTIHDLCGASFFTHSQAAACRLMLVSAIVAFTSFPAGAAGPGLSPAAAEAKAKQVEAQMTDDERFSLLISVFGPVADIGVPRDPRIPTEVINTSAGYTPGIARLGIPALQSSDASMGVTNPGYRPHDKGATAFPALILAGSTFNPELSRQGGAAIGREARIRGFNVQLAGGVNLQRDPRNGRNFEYYSEDPWVSAVLAAAAVNGIQGEGVISTLKHYTLNANETNRHWLDAVVDPAAHRESDLLAFQIAIEKSQPGSIMCGYNKVNGEYACGNHHLLNEVLKDTWGYKGYVMSDWGATPSWDFAIKGLDQESGIQIDVLQWGGEAFTDKLRKAYADGAFPKARLSDMVRRMLYAAYSVGIDNWGSAPEVDLAKHNAIALEMARQGIVLLENDGVLPIAANRPLKIAVIGGHAHTGIISGTGSGAVNPVGGYAGMVNIGGTGVGRRMFLFAPSPLAELKKALPGATIEFDPGLSPAEAALTAKRADLVIAFGIRVEGEGVDSADLSLPWGQDAVIDAVASANPNTIVVLETGNPVSMPWRSKVKAIVQAWYPGQAGAQAIAEILTGKVNPSGRLPITFPESLDQTPRPQLSGLGTPWSTPTTVRYDEGAEVGYRWHTQKGLKPMYPFGHGLGYTSFAYKDLKVSGGDTVTATFTITNTGTRTGADVPQVYLYEAPGEKRQRLLGFQRVELQPGESRTVTLEADPRLLARFDGATGRWQIAKGSHRIVLGRNATDVQAGAVVSLNGRSFGR